MEGSQKHAGSGEKDARLEKAVFAGGCFWCMVSPFDKLKGVRSVVSGYTGGHTENPTYEEVSSGRTGHFEAVEITYDPAEISYQQLLDVFWRLINPTDAGGQFIDRGPQYRAAIFYTTPRQKAEAEQSKEALGRAGRLKGPVATEILPAQKFYPAEDYHQDYYKKNPIRYGFYYYGSGRGTLAQKKG